MTPAERKAAFARCRAGRASDADRVRLAESRGGTTYGPLELERCARHKRNTRAVRWTWLTPTRATFDAHAQAIQHSDPEIVRNCPRCVAEADDAA